MLVSEIRSRPIYSELVLEDRASRHILVGEGQGAAALVKLFKQSVGHAKRGPDLIRDVYYLTSDSEGQCLLEGLGPYASVPPRIFTLQQELETALSNALAGACMGTRLYVAGKEGFIWKVVGVAREAGMSDEEIQMERRGSLARPVLCIHCKHIHLNVTTNIYHCPGCSLPLLVRDHFSKRLGAYQAVRADAESPGELPKVEEIYP